MARGYEDMTEEERYSGVNRDEAGASRYLPPHRRATGKAGSDGRGRRGKGEAGGRARGGERARTDATHTGARVRVRLAHVRAWRAQGRVTHGRSNARPRSTPRLARPGAASGRRTRMRRPLRLRRRLRRPLRLRRCVRTLSPVCPASLLTQRLQAAAAAAAATTATTATAAAAAATAPAPAPAVAAAAPAAAAPAAAAPAPAAAAESKAEGAGDKEKPGLKSRLNPNAKEFVFKPTWSVPPPLRRRSCSS